MNRDLRKFIFKISALCMSVFGLLLLLIVGVIKLESNYFSTSYQSVINNKFNNLINEHNNKIVLLGGSNLAFGLNEDLLSQQLGRPVVNMGLHAGFGTQFIVNVGKANIKSGDIIVIALEPEHWSKTIPMTIDLVETGIKDLRLYKYVGINNTPKLMQYLPIYTLKKFDSIVDGDRKATGVYSSGAFDEKGQMILSRKNHVFNDELLNKLGFTEYSEDISDETVEIVNEFSRYAQDKGVRVYITFTPILKQTFRYTNEEIVIFQNNLNEKLDAKIISNMQNYIFDIDYMYDTLAHCNNAGEKKRTLLLAEDLKQYVF